MSSPIRCDERRDTCGVCATGRTRGRSVHSFRSRCHLLTIMVTTASEDGPEQGRTVGSSGTSACEQVQSPPGLIGQKPSGWLHAW